MSGGFLSNMIGGGVVEVTASPSSSGLRSNNNNNDDSNAGNGTGSGLLYPQQANQLPLASATQALVPPKKRGHPGNPDPDAEVIALSPKSLLATNRFVCEICNKGFQRDQNLQLHRRGHNLPWKLKQRSNKDAVRKKVYVCPEPSCAHHHPTRALGDLTGIKKHYFRKHGEKKWKCDKCTKRYAVHSDWKAHSKICGTREYRCDCGTLFSRRDSFTTHRAFCDALAHESSSRSLLTQKYPLGSTSFNNLRHLPASSHNFQPSYNVFSIKTEQAEGLHHHHHHHLINPAQEFLLSSSGTLDTSRVHQSNPNPTLFMSSAANSTSGSPHMSATALLQRAAQMGVAMSKPSPSSADILVSPHHMLGSHDHIHRVLDESTTDNDVANSSGLVPSSGGDDRWMSDTGGLVFLLSGFESFRNEASASLFPADKTVTTLGGTDQVAVDNAPGNPHLDRNHNTTVMSPRSNVVSSSEASLHGSSYLSSSFDHDAAMNGLMNTLEDDYACDTFRGKFSDPHASFRRSGQGMTRDFLGLRAFSSLPEDFVNIGGFELMHPSSSSTNNKNNGYGQQDKDQYQTHWQN